MIITCERGRFEAGLDDVVYIPTHQANRNPVLYCHGMNGTGIQAVAGSLPNVPIMLKLLAKRQFQIVAPSLGNSWGNSGCMTDLETAHQWALDNGSEGPAIVVGVSMGGAIALNYAAGHPDDVACVIGILPAVDLQALRVSDVLGTRAAIDTAHGVTYPAALPAGVSPVEQTDELIVPIQLWYSSDDAVSENINVIDEETNCDLYNLGALGHTNTAIAAVQLEVLQDFIEANI